MYSFSVPYMSTPVSQAKEMVEWARENCPSYIANRVDTNRNDGVLRNHNYLYCFYFFNDEDDCNYFKLRWT